MEAESKSKNLTACAATQTVGEKKLGKSTTAIIAQEKGKINMDVFDRSEPWLEAERRAAKDDEWQQTLPICERCGRRIFNTEYVHIELRKHILDLCLECVDDMTIINEAAEVAE